MLYDRSSFPPKPHEICHWPSSDHQNIIKVGVGYVEGKNLESIIIRNVLRAPSCLADRRWCSRVPTYNTYLDIYSLMTQFAILEINRGWDVYCVCEVSSVIIRDHPHNKKNNVCMSDLKKIFWNLGLQKIGGLFSCSNIFHCCFSIV